MTPGQNQRAEIELATAGDALRGGLVLLDTGLRKDAVSRLYYAVFHAARAALVVRGRYAKTHSGQRTLFNEAFGPTPIIGKLFDLRVKADYETDELKETDAELRHLTDEAAAFVERCRILVEEVAADGPDEPDPPPDL